ncbi:suppressor of fused domain protein [Corynebacterium lizhenjunii]|uniref:suppressor of fused domain protein n=1 Tax=Corynebacterium lizhenjunii TaxID=2709394 RepID=UPI0013EA140D|nr:suppressor of fused domain protein [Corynebacterium lizhenjunii]
MNGEETAYWLDSVVPAPLEFKDVDGHRLALADVGKGENLVATTRFAEVDTGLQAHDPADGRDKDVRCEIVAVARAGQAEIAQVVIEAAELLADARVIPAQPGTLLPMLGPGRHGVLIAPYLWGGQAPQVKEPDRWTLVVQLVVLSDSEYAYAVEEGVAALQEAVAENDIDLLDWSRLTVD